MEVENTIPEDTEGTEQQASTALPAGVPKAGNPPKGFVNVEDAPAVPTTPSDVNTGNTVLDTAISVLASTAGATTADLQRIAGNAIAYKDPDLIDRAFLQEKFGKHAVQFEALANAAIQEQERAERNATAEVHNLAGGAQQWEQAVAVFNQSAPEHIRAAVKALIDTGNTKQGAALLIDAVRNSGLIPNTNPLLSGGANAPSSQGALGKNEFLVAMAKLKSEAGNRSLETGAFAERYQELLQRRAMGRSLGY